MVGLVVCQFSSPTDMASVVRSAVNQGKIYLSAVSIRFINRMENETEVFLKFEYKITLHAKLSRLKRDRVSIEFSAPVLCTSARGPASRKNTSMKNNFVSQPTLGPANTGRLSPFHLTEADNSLWSERMNVFSGKGNYTYIRSNSLSFALTES